MLMNPYRYVVPAIESNAPAKNWRLPISAAVDSLGDTTLQTSLVNSAAALSFPSYTVATGTTRTVTQDIEAVTSPGALLYFIFDQVVTPTAQRSFDGGTTWQDLTFNISSYQGGDITTAVKRGQMIEIPAGAASKVRLSVANASGSLATVYLKMHQRPAIGKADAWVHHGASLESTMPSLQMIQAWRAAFPDFDPIFFNWAQSSQSGARVKALVDDSITRIPWVHNYLFDIGGNDVTSGRPYVQGVTTLPSFGQALDAINAAGHLALPCNISYRNYTGAPAVNGGANQENGSAPYNVNIIIPTMLQKTPWAVDPVLGIARLDWYNAVMVNRELLSDDVHHSDAMRATVTIPLYADVYARYVYTGAWPLGFMEQQVAKVETLKVDKDYSRAVEMFTFTPDSAGKAALLARLNAALVLPANTAAPALSGAFVVGAIVNGTPGTWAGFPTPTLAYQWYADGVAISGATATAYTITSAELGKVLKFRVTATNAKGSTSVDSANSAAVTAGSSYDPLTQTLLARMTAQPTVTQANKIDTLMKVLKTMNRTAFGMFAAHDKQAALLDWVRSDVTFTLSAQEPAFTALGGFKGTGSSIGIDLKCTLNAIAGYTQNSGSYGFGISILGSGPIIGQLESGAPVYSTTPSSFRHNNGSGSVVSATALAVGNFIVTRTASTGFTIRKDQVARETATQVSAALGATSLAGLRAVNVTGTHQMSHFHIGPSLTDAQELELNAAIATYLA
ncbi:hypothetical protein [Pseudomonas turukhanskensis]|uniref:Uncharacterized protein n=1 Tax=Pseudomonas turukhanskensis TaxID=1806536 RepID=A0A9W6NE55_9PSED|nr:hypothetical protein [Pseudomonas turukhanskensis]GLK88329.1 hypothetical protein GCM10017655_13910 [Pseudomonas turukhanskensis]